MMKRLFSNKKNLSAILLLSTTSLFASRFVTEGDVNTKDKTVLSQLGRSISLQCTKKGQGSRALATEAYVNACDAEILSTVTTTVSSPFKVGQILCGNTHPYTCPANNPTPWGIVFYVDPYPQTSGYYGLAMSILDLVIGKHSGTDQGTVWGVGLTQNTNIGANNYNIYGGINGTFKDTQGHSQSGNTKIYCAATGNDCTNPGSPISAFSTCVNYSNGPSLAGGWYLPSVNELVQMFSYAETQALPLSITGVEQFNSYWYWSSSQANGSYDANLLGNIGYNPGGTPTNHALYFGFYDGILNDNRKDDANEGVRCVQALPM